MMHQERDMEQSSPAGCHHVTYRRIYLCACSIWLLP